MNHLSIDLETFGTTPDAAIRSIGAAFFNPNTGEIGPTFYRNVTEHSQAYRRVTEDTRKWWLTQPKAAQDALEIDQVSLEVALDEFSKFITDHTGMDATPWGNGAGFDLAILADAYIHEKRVLPWKFWNERCLRTLKNLIPCPAIEFAGVPHNALDDAMHQARMISGCLHRLGLMTHAYNLSR
jgi:exodeoxyribonuclease VIII